MQTAKQAFLASILKPGEQYTGIILGKNDEADYRLILLSGEAESVSWTDAGSLPPQPVANCLHAENNCFSISTSRKSSSVPRIGPGNSTLAIQIVPGTRISSMATSAATARTTSSACEPSAE